MSTDTAIVVGHSRIESRILLRRDPLTDTHWEAQIEGDDERYLGPTPQEAVETLCRLRTGVHMGIDWDKVNEAQPA